MCLWLAGKLIGNINDAPFHEVWNSKEACRIRREMIEGFLPDVCEKALCKYRQEAVMAYISEKKAEAGQLHEKSC